MLENAPLASLGAGAVENAALACLSATRAFKITDRTRLWAAECYEMPFGPAPSRQYSKKPFQETVQETWLGYTTLCCTSLCFPFLVLWLGLLSNLLFESTGPCHTVLCVTCSAPFCYVHGMHGFTLVYIYIHRGLLRVSRGSPVSPYMVSDSLSTFNNHWKRDQPIFKSTKHV